MSLEIEPGVPPTPEPDFVSEPVPEPEVPEPEKGRGVPVMDTDVGLRIAAGLNNPIHYY